MQYAITHKSKHTQKTILLTSMKGELEQIFMWNKLCDDLLAESSLVWAVCTILSVELI